MLSIAAYAAYGAAALLASVVINIFLQLALPAKNEPPVVFHWFPFLGNTISYGMDPYKFMFEAREKYGDVFTFILLGKKTTVYLGIKGNDFILNGKERDLNAEEVYGPLCNPVFGKDVVYDCPNSKLMEQKKFMKFGLTSEQLGHHVGLIENEVNQYIKTSPHFKGTKGEVDIAEPMAEITIYTAGRALQGEEVRANLNSDFGHYFHDLEKGFSPINFMLPYVPLPHNRKRDAAHIKMRDMYMEIIRKRRAENKEATPDMLWNLMQCSYKNGVKVPDTEIACMMLTLLMAGQHNSSNQASWALLHLADKPELQEQLLREQVENLAVNGEVPPIAYDDLDKLPLHRNVIKETLRIHNSIHSILRRVKQPLAVPGTNYTIPVGHNVLASPGISAMTPEHFPNPAVWDPHRWDNNVEEKEDEGELVDYGYGRMSAGTKGPYLPFGGGRHRCIGEKFAYVNLTVIIATLVRNFKWTTPPGKPGVPKTDYSSMFSCPQQPASIVWERRSPEKA